MTKFEVYYIKQDLKKIQEQNLTSNVKSVELILQRNPFEPPYEKLVGNLKGYYSRRINIQHRLVYQVLETAKAVKIISLWSHYE